jgi:hypothetical protein
MHSDRLCPQYHPFYTSADIDQLGKSFEKHAKRSAQMQEGVKIDSGSMKIMGPVRFDPHLAYR